MMNRYRVEVNMARKGAEPVWHYLMEDEYSPCEFADEAEARAVIHEAGLIGDEIRLIGFTTNGIGNVVP